ncbi:transposase domain-containing protein [Streptomyces hirsutus]|uniref:transposase domain-containing protein n=1 Tax=Streptomyces hirsutus TaxID=35620 RepID=UPI00366765D3
MAGGRFAPGHLGELTHQLIPFEKADEALKATGRVQERLRDLPSRAVVTCCRPRPGSRERDTSEPGASSRAPWPVCPWPHRRRTRRPRPAAEPDAGRGRSCAQGRSRYSAQRYRL